MNYFVAPDLFDSSTEVLRKNMLISTTPVYHLILDAILRFWLEMNFWYIVEDIGVFILLLCWRWQVLLTISSDTILYWISDFNIDSKMHLDNDIWQYCSLINWAISVSYLCCFECVLHESRNDNLDFRKMLDVCDSYWYCY